MRSVTFLAGMLAGAALVALAPGCDKNKEHHLPSVQQNGAKTGVENAESITNTRFCTDCTLDNLPGEPAAEFANVVARYRDNHQKLYNAFAQYQLNNSAYPNTGTQKNSQFQDTRSCMFDMDRIKKFICLTERYAATVNLSSAQLGLRFYYGIYPTNYQFDQRYSDMHTLYIAATYRNSSGKYIDFDARKTAISGSIVTLDNLIVGNDPDMFLIGGRTATPPPPNSTINHGDLCPPGTGCDPTLGAIDQMAPLRPLGTVFSY